MTTSTSLPPGGPLARGRVWSRQWQVTKDDDAVWFRIDVAPGGLGMRLAHRMAGAPEVRQVDHHDDDLSLVVATGLGVIRTRIDLPRRPDGPLHVRSTFRPSEPVALPDGPRDLVFRGEDGDASPAAGVIHTSQRGPRSGVLFWSLVGSEPATFFYLQDFSSSARYFQESGSSPADRVGHEWPGLGYSLPGSGSAHLRAAEEYVISDAFLCFVPQVPDGPVETARTYLDLFASVYLAMDRPHPAYHDWPTVADATLRDLTFSAEVSEAREGHRYLLPYVSDRSKPPESMVQMTVLLPVREYDEWSGRKSRIGRDLLGSIPTFFDEGIGSLVRWLPGQPFLAQTEDVQDHRSMDSWYLYHSLFNLARVARLGDRTARRLFVRSLPYAIKVARRFDYRWPVFYDLETLDTIRGESSPGRGGENDVAGLYALVMIEAFELTGEQRYLDEGCSAAQSLADLGFRMGYQTNTTGFGAEAMLRLARLTGDDAYLGLADMCVANLLDNVWLWDCGFGHGPDRRTFFGMFPLHDAPYLAAYEESEMVAKVHDYLNRGRDLIRPSVRLLLAEYVKYALDRLWAYLPAHQPSAALSTEPRVGAVSRELAIPLEDLQDGWLASGQVGQEVYGAGLPFVLTTRHFRHLSSAGALLFCDYPAFDLEVQAQGTSGRCTLRLGGDPRARATIRIVPRDASRDMAAFECRAGRPRRLVKGAMTTEGHVVYQFAGDESVTLSWHPSP